MARTVSTRIHRFDGMSLVYSLLTVGWIAWVLLTDTGTGGGVRKGYWQGYHWGTAYTATSIQSGGSNHGRRRQRLVLLAGPHKTGTSSIQTNLWKWSTPFPGATTTIASTINMNSNSVVDEEKASVLPNWVWAVPPQIIQAESSDPHPWTWTPAKGFYPLLEALRNPKYPLPKRSLFQKFTTHRIVKMYAEFIERVWSEGYSVVMGTEAMDNLVKDPDGRKILNALADEVLSPVTLRSPTDTAAVSSSSDGSETPITVVVVYRTPKSKHLVSVWHQNALKRTSPGFHRWITTTSNTLGALDALGMIEIILTTEATEGWEVVVVDASGVKRDDLDLSDVVRCEVLGVECGGGGGGGAVVDGGGGNGDPVIVNVREDGRPPDVSDDVLERMEEVLRGYDCRYHSLFFDERFKSRLRVLHPHELMGIMEGCRKKNEAGMTTYPRTRKEMKKRIVRIALDK